MKRYRQESFPDWELGKKPIFQQSVPSLSLSLYFSLTHITQLWENLLLLLPFLNTRTHTHMSLPHSFYVKAFATSPSLFHSNTTDV